MTPNSELFLLRLPSEILLQIFRHVGRTFFCEQLNRLTVNQKWYEHARVILTEDVHLSSSGIKRLVQLSSLKGHSEESTAKPLRVATRSSNGTLRSFMDIKKISIVLDVREVLKDVKNLSQRISQWFSDTSNDLTALALILEKCEKLSSVRLRARQAFVLSTMHSLRHPLHYLDRGALATFQIALLNRSLTTLDLDTCGSDLTNPLDPRWNDHHACRMVAVHLKTLRSLRLRMRHICPVALRPSGDLWQCQTSTEVSLLQESKVTDPITLPLRDLLVNLSLPDSFNNWPSARHNCSFCFKPSLDENELRVLMEEEMEALLARMRFPRIARILYHRLVYGELETEAKDLITGRKMILLDRADWCEQGEIVFDGEVRA